MWKSAKHQPIVDCTVGCTRKKTVCQLLQGASQVSYNRQRKAKQFQMETMLTIFHSSWTNVGLDSRRMAVSCSVILPQMSRQSARSHSKMAGIHPIGTRWVMDTKGHCIK